MFMFQIRPDGLGYTNKVKPEDYTYREFGWRWKVANAVKSLPVADTTNPAYFLFGAIISVEFNSIQQNLDTFLALNQEIGVVAEDLSRGIVTRTYAGYAEGDFSPEETTYALAYWGL